MFIEELQRQQCIRAEGEKSIELPQTENWTRHICVVYMHLLNKKINEYNLLKKLIGIWWNLKCLILDCIGRFKKNRIVQLRLKYTCYLLWKGESNKICTISLNQSNETEVYKKIYRPFHGRKDNPYVTKWWEHLIILTIWSYSLIFSWNSRYPFVYFR